MNKFELSKSIDIAPVLKHKKQRPIITNIATSMARIENSYFIDEIRNPAPPEKILEWINSGEVDFNKLKPFVGYITVGVDSEETGEEISVQEKHLCAHIKKVADRWCVALMWRNPKSYTIVGVGLVDEENLKIEYLRNTTSAHAPDDSVLDIFTRFDGPVMALIIEVMMSDFVVVETEPTSFKFKRDVPELKREMYRTYVLRLKEETESVVKFKHNREKLFGKLDFLESSDMIREIDKHNSYVQRVQDSVLFSGLEGRIDPDVDSTKYDLRRTPFPNFSITFTTPRTDNFYTTLLVNCMVSGPNLEVSVFISNKHTRRGLDALRLSDVFLLRPNYTHERIYFDVDDFLPEVRDKVLAEMPKHLRNRLVNQVKNIISGVLEIVDTYEVEKVQGRLRRVPIANVNKGELPFEPERVHMVVNFEERRRYEYIGKGHHACGWRMKEHDRIAHERILRDGRVVQVKSSRINKGLGDILGVVSKEFVL